MLNLPKYCMNVKEKLLVSFSGGRTSAFMLKWILDNWQDKYELKVVFANTGKEHEGTLEFVRDCEIQFGCEIIWVESVPKTKKGWGVTYKQVNFETANRDGKPFEDAIKLLSIPCSSSPWCSIQLKREAIKSYLRDLGWKKYYTAIGIRADEIDRCNENYKKQRLIYPLVSDIPMDKKMITFFWERQKFDLKIPYGMGNCDNCWKKSMKILAYNATNYPETFDWWQNMTDKYSMTVIRNPIFKPPFNFYRGGLSPVDIFKVAKMNARQLDLFVQHEKLDGCSESCEPF